MVVVLLTLLVIYVTMVYGPIAAMLVEMFPTRIRYTSMSLPYHIGNGWFGGFLPPVAFAVVAATGQHLRRPVVSDHHRCHDPGHRYAVRTRNQGQRHQRLTTIPAGLDRCANPAFKLPIGSFFAAGPPQGKKPLGGSKPAQRAQRGGSLPPGRPKAKSPLGAASPHSGRSVGPLPPGRPRQKAPRGSKPAQRAQRGGSLPPGRPKAKAPRGQQARTAGAAVGPFCRRAAPGKKPLGGNKPAQRAQRGGFCALRIIVRRCRPHGDRYRLGSQPFMAYSGVPVPAGTGTCGRRSMRGCRDACAYAPIQAGARFSMKARTPSWKSADI